MKTTARSNRARMAETGELSESELDAIDAEVMAEIEQSVTDAKAARPTAEQVTEDVYIQYSDGQEGNDHA